MIIDIANDEPKTKEKPKETVTTTAKWEEKIKEVASSNKNPNEKFDETGGANMLTVINHLKMKLNSLEMKSLKNIRIKIH